MNVTPPEIQDKHAAFAKAVAAVADAHGVERFKLTFRPHYDPRIEGELAINYSAVDGRGRPARSLVISMTANLSVILDAGLIGDCGQDARATGGGVL